MENTANAPDLGGIVQKSMVKIGTWMKLLPAEEVRGLKKALDEIEGANQWEMVKSYKIIENILAARVNVIRKQTFDAKKRTLIGTRVNRDFADRCKKAAESSGRSLNRWVYTACWNQILRQNQGAVEAYLQVDEPDTNPWYGW